MMTMVLAAVFGCVASLGCFFWGRSWGVRQGMIASAGLVDEARADAALARQQLSVQEELAAHACRNEAAAVALTKELRADLRDSERRRLEVAACIGQAVDERKVWEDMYLSQNAGCAAAQHMMTTEIEALAKAANRAVSPQIKQVIGDTRTLLARPAPPATPLGALEAKIAAVAAAENKAAP